jgi:hypothetical protein
MKPINEKERTGAFTQFLLMFIVTVILIVLAVFCDIKIDQKEKRILKSEIDSLKNEKVYLRNLSNEIDSMYKTMNKMDNASSVDFENIQSDIIRQIGNWSSQVSKDTTNLERIELSIAKALNTWAYDKRWVNNGRLEKNICDDIKVQKDLLQTRYDALREKHDSYVAANPAK